VNFINAGVLRHYARRWILVAIIPAVLVAMLGYARTASQPRTYQATAVMYVQKSTSSGQGGAGAIDVYASSLLAGSYSQMVGYGVIARRASRLLANKYPGYQIGGVSSQQKGQAGQALTQQSATQLVTISVTDTEPQRAIDAANAVVTAFIQTIQSIERAKYAADLRSLNLQLASGTAIINDLNRRISRYTGDPSGLTALRSSLDNYQIAQQNLFTSTNTFRLQADEDLHTVTPFAPADAAGLVGPHPSRTAASYGFVALLLLSGALFAFEYFNDLPRTPSEIEDVVGAPILGTVQHFNAGRGIPKLVTATRPRSPMAESYRLIRTNIQFTNIDNPPRTVLVTSALPAEGKSTTAANLAEVFAQSGLSVTLIDGDMRRPSLHKIFEIDGRRDGLTTLLVGNQMNGGTPAVTSQPNLRMVPSGPIPPNPADLLGSHRMQSLIRHFREQSDLVMVDTPPVLAVADAAILSTMVDGVILVCDPNKTKRRDLRHAREAIEAVGGKILGVVVNRLHPRGGMYYYYGSYNYNYASVTDDGSSSGSRAPDRERSGSRRKRERAER